MPRQGISWGPIVFVVATLFASAGLITWGLSSSPDVPTSSIRNPAVQSDG